jgi:hypothetical protein
MVTYCKAEHKTTIKLETLTLRLETFLLGNTALRLRLETFLLESTTFLLQSEVFLFGSNFP